LRTSMLDGVDLSDIQLACVSINVTKVVPPSNHIIFVRNTGKLVTLSTAGANICTVKMNGVLH
jgi:hypothetical protein